MTDLFLPQFHIHLEVDEAQHLTELHAEADRRRTEDIQSVTNDIVHRIVVAERLTDGTVRFLPLSTINRATDEFVEWIKQQKVKMTHEATFQPWDFEGQYDPEQHIIAGYIDRDEKVAFLRQRDALRCFGYQGGDYQRGTWKIGDGSGDQVWFPRLYEMAEWNNELTPDRKWIIERPKSADARKRNRQHLKHNRDTGNRIVFARAKDPLGRNLYRYVGTFQFEPELSSIDEVRYRFVRGREKLL